MKRSEYEKELIMLYGKAVEREDWRLSFELLERGASMGIDNFTGEENGN